MLSSSVAYPTDRDAQQLRADQPANTQYSQLLAMLTVVRILSDVDWRNAQATTAAA